MVPLGEEFQFVGRQLDALVCGVKREGIQLGRTPWRACIEVYRHPIELAHRARALKPDAS